MTGQNFTTSTRILWDGVALATSFDSDAALEAEVPTLRLNRPGPIAIAVTGADGKPGPPLRFTLNPPLAWITPSLLPAGERGQFYAQALGVTGGTPPVRYSLTAGTVPPGLHLDGYNGSIVGYATQPGSFDLSIRASDAAGAMATHQMNLTVVGELHIVTGPALPPGLAGTAYSFQLAASGGTPPYTEWKVTTGALPAGLVLDPKTGGLTGVPPPSAATAQFTVSVRDAAGKFATAAMMLLVRTPLAVPTADAADGLAEDDPLSLTLSATGGDAPFTWTLESGELPPGIVFDAPAATLRGVLERSGEYRLGFKVRDAHAAEAGTTVQLQVAPRLRLTGFTTPGSAVAGSPVSLPLTATGGAPPYSFRITSGSLPAGLSLSAAGRIQGTPPSAGEWTAEVGVSDRAGHTARQEVRLSVTAPPLPALTLAPLSGLQPSQQTKLDLRLERAYTSPLELIVELAFDGPPDPAVQLSTGGRLARLSVPVGQLAPAAPLWLQTGTTAGTIILAARLEALDRAASTGQNAVRQSAPVAATPPRIRSLEIRKTTDGFQITVAAFSPTRQFDRARFVFDDSIELALPLGEMTSVWYASEASAPFGTALIYRQNFTVRGDGSRLRGVSVSLSNSVGASAPAGAAF